MSAHEWPDYDYTKIDQWNARVKQVQEESFKVVVLMGLVAILAMVILVNYS